MPQLLWQVRGTRHPGGFELERCEPRLVMATFAIPHGTPPTEGEHILLKWDGYDRTYYELHNDPRTASDVAKVTPGDLTPYTDVAIDGNAGYETLTLDFSAGPLSRRFPTGDYMTAISFTATNGGGAEMHNTLIVVGGDEDDLVVLNQDRSITVTANGNLVADGEPAGESTTIFYDASVTQVVFDLGGGDNSIVVVPEPAIGGAVLTWAAVIAGGRRARGRDLGMVAREREASKDREHDPA